MIELNMNSLQECKQQECLFIKVEGKKTSIQFDLRFKCEHHKRSS